MQVLVTGGAGFVGSHVVEELLRKGLSVSVVDSLVTGRREHVPAQCRFYQVDVASPEFLTIAAEINPDAIIHLAAQISVSASVANPEEDARVNIGGMLNVLRAAMNNSCRRVVFSSSAAVYGNPVSLPLSEDASLRPLSPYGVSKRAAEDYIQVSTATSGLSAAILRYGNIYGPRQAVSAECGVITIFVQALLSGKQPTIFGDGTATRDYVYVEDVAKATYLALEHNDSFIANISSGKEVTVLDLWNLLAKLGGKDIAADFGPERPGDIARSSLNPAQAYRYLGWRATTSLEDGLSKTLGFYSQRGERLC